MSTPANTSQIETPNSNPINDKALAFCGDLIKRADDAVRLGMSTDDAILFGLSRACHHRSRPGSTLARIAEIAGEAVRQHYADAVRKAALATEAKSVASAYDSFERAQAELKRDPAMSWLIFTCNREFFASANLVPNAVIAIPSWDAERRGWRSVGRQLHEALFGPLPVEKPAAPRERDYPGGVSPRRF